MNPSRTHVTCPTCKKAGPGFVTPWSPFGSKRCQLIDLGKWLGGEHVVSEPLHPEHLEKDSGLWAPDHEPGSAAGAN